jgi:hypothetical protein
MSHPGLPPPSAKSQLRVRQQIARLTPARPPDSRTTDAVVGKFS